MFGKINILLIVLTYLNIFKSTMCIVDKVDAIEKFKSEQSGNIPRSQKTMAQIPTDNKLLGIVLGGSMNGDNERSVITNIEKIKTLANILEELGDKLIPLIMENPPARPVLNRANDVDILSGSLHNGNIGNNIRSLHVFRALTNDD